MHRLKNLVVMPPYDPSNLKETPMDLKSLQNRHLRVTLVELSSILSKRLSIREQKAMQVKAGQFNLQLLINA